MNGIGSALVAPLILPSTAHSCRTSAICKMTSVISRSRPKTLIQRLPR